MKKKNILNLIRYYTEQNDTGFRAEAYTIAEEFEKNGDSQLAGYIMALLSNANILMPQSQSQEFQYLERVKTDSEMLLLPENIKNDLLGGVNAINKHLDINKFLFYGSPGTGKTEAAKQFARLLNRDLYLVDFSRIVDSHLGQTQKNLISLFKEIDGFSPSGKLLVLFDEFDSIALDRIDSNDHREMGRAASELLKLMDRMNSNVVLVATTNLYLHFDKAILRRFDAKIDFDRYSKEDLAEIAEEMLDYYLSKMKVEKKNVRLFRKIIRLANPVPMPGLLKNIIKTALAFSDPSYGLDYLRRLYTAFCGHQPKDLAELKAQGFTVREIGILLNDAKSNIDRKLKGVT